MAREELVYNEKGEIHGEKSYGLLTVDNVHCYSRDGVMGDINGMKNWFKANQKGCGSFTRAGIQFNNINRNW